MTSNLAISSSLLSVISRIAPGIDLLRSYDRHWLRPDLIAGITLAAYLLPAGIGDASLAGLPAISVPCGFDSRGLPVGLQITGNHFAEATLLGVAHQYQQAHDWHLRVPKGTPL